MTDESAVKVCIRVRPLLEREEIAEPAQLFWKADEKAIHQIDAGNSSKSFSFDRVFTADETTSQLYQDIAKPLVVSTVEGYNGTIFAYGQTSSGKTFTMMGGGRIPGVIPLAVEDVFQSIKNFPKKEFLLRVSYMEIYNETVTDLLVDSWKRKPLEVRETINKNIYVAELTEELITSSAQALAWIRKGEKNRHYGKTKMNQRSSRSHTIFRMILESRERSDPASGENADGAVIVSHLNLVDLAGSERASQTGAEGARFKEGCHINRSLLILGQVMKKLTDESQKGYTNYRDSKLTRILQNSLGGNAKTVIICTITPITLEETLSTLQFASTAKKMKNDPHVTEVSDDGALLKRYRNEIVDLKRRLQEVSGVTHATATEKDFLSLLLQEKDQLQREQQDRIRNLTKLLVTSSNLVLVQKMPKRRVTWGGKMLRLAHPSACDDGSSDVSFAEPFSRKRKADYLTELGEEDEDFDSHWGIPDEPSVDMEMSQSSGDSPKDFVSPNQLREISGKVSNLEVQLEMESQQKEEAMTKIEALDGQVAELHLQLETEEQQKQEAEEMMQTTEQRAAELQLQLQTETQQRLEAVEKVEMLEFRLTDLERQLEDHRITQTESDQQMKQDFAETIQLCESLTSEKDSVVAERDYLKQELGMFIEQMNSLEKEKAALSQDLEEKREMEEFETLEEEFRKEHENEMQHEVSSLKAAVESSELQCLELKNKLESVSEQLKTKTEFAEELQSMSGKDLVQEVATLRRSLYDAEGLSRDTKKEWAVLRSQNMALEEVNGSLTADHQQMETEVTSLRFMLDAEKSRYRQMQSDLQKELNVAFDENTKLTSLLDGKVPKDVMDSVELERKVAVLNKELTASREAAKVLRAQLASFQTLPNTVDSLTKQVCELNEELGAVQTQRDNLLCVHEDEAQQLRDSLQTSQQELSAAALRETELSQHCADVTQQLESLRSDLQRLDAERSRLTAPGEERGPELEESDEHRASLEGRVSELQQLMKDVEEKLSDSEASRRTEEEISRELQEQLKQLTEELQAERAGHQIPAEPTEELLSSVTALTADRDQLRRNLQEHVNMLAETQVLLHSLQQELQEQKQQNCDLVKESDPPGHMQRESLQLQCGQDEEVLRRGAQSSTEELLSTVAALTAERDQLQLDLQENVEIMIENQAELRTALDQNREHKEQIKDLETAQTSKLDGLPGDASAQLEQLQTQIRTLTAELERARAERDDLLSERTVDTQTSSEETETLQSRGTSLSEERDKLQETVEGLRQEKQQLRAELEDRMETLQTQIEQLQGHAQAVREQKQQLEEELQRSEEKATETQSLLQSLQEELHEQKEKTSQLEKLYEQISDSQLQIQALTEELERARAERDDLLSDQESSRQTSSEETETLQSRLMSLSDERDQLQETVEGLRQEKQQLRAELEDRMETLQTQVRDLAEKLEAVEAERHNLLSDQESSRQMSSEETETLQSRLMSLSEERDQLQETVEGLRQEKQQLRAELEDRMETLQTQVRDLAEKLEAVEAERHNLLSDQESSRQTSSEETEKLQSRLMSLSEERDQLQETVEGLRQEKQQLRTELEDRMEAISAVQDKLSCQEELNLQQRSEGGEREAELQELLQEQLKSHREGRAQAAAEAEAAQRSLRDANTTISALREQLSSSEQNAGVGETTSSRLQESARQLQELLGVFQHIIDTCAKYNFTALDEGLTQEYRLKDTQLSSLTKPTKAAYDAVCQLEQATLQSFTQIEEQLHVRAQGISSLFEQLVQKDLDVFEERRLQDLLLSRAPAASHSVTDHDLHSVWEQRLTELLDRRLLYLQKMDVISKRLRTHQGSFILELRAEVKDREKLKEQMQTLVGNQPIGCSQLDSLLRQEVNRRLATARGKMRPLQAIVEEEDGLFEELKQLQDQVDSQLREAKSKSWTLLQALEGAPLQTELSLLKDNQQLALQLQHSQHTARALHIQKEQLEEAQVKASSRISSHKQATQLLQTELQDSRALLEDQENAIQTLRSRLRELERREPPSAAELEKLQSKLFKLEVKLSSALDQHQQEVQTMTTLLSEKEASLRKLKEALRKSQQQGDESFLQGKDLHTRLTHPRGLVMKSSVMLDKTKLEKEVTQLQLKITELESLMSSQRAEISKWKNRAIKLNMKSKAEVKLSPPRTPTKRGLPMASTSFNLLSSPKKSLLTPKKMLEPCGKLLDSPKLSLLNSPKSGFFDGDGASEVLSRTCPKQFFDNSSLGTIPEVSYVPDSPGAEKDGAVGVDRKEQPWPQSPKEEEMCKSQ
ncbi:centromere-associated protein E isoform X5 [Brachyistius frenatus]|uniref:centromere-associated protein E isoform X5 n=1 Tax=Brachyistius frenatus TaxID=100188 RepID=UPI0037E8B3EC